MKKLIIMFFIFTSLKMLGVEQIPEKLIFEDVEYELNSFPLENYFNQFPQKKPKERIISTSLWRGYIATYEIKNNILYLINIEIQILSSDSTNNNKINWISVIKEVFPNQDSIIIDWFTGLLLLSPININKNSKIINNYIILEINVGFKIKSIKFDFKSLNNFIDQQFIEFKNTNDYIIIFTFYKNYYKSKMKINNIIKNNILEFSTKILI